MKISFYQHQQQALDETEGQNRVAYYLDMGLGKTFVGAEKMVRLGKGNVLMTTDVVDYYTHRRLCVGAEGKAEFLRLDHNILDARPSEIKFCGNCVHYSVCSKHGGDTFILHTNASDCELYCQK